MNTSLTQAPAYSGFGGRMANGSPRTPFVPLQRISAKSAIWSFLLAIALVCPAMMLAALSPVPSMAHEQYLSVVLLPGIAILKHVFLGPLLEEVIYRGFFVQLARRYMPLWLAIVLSAAVFGATHFPGGLATMVPASAMGMVLGWLAVRSGSLYLSFLCHAVFNFTAGFVVAPAFGITEKVLALPTDATSSLPIMELFPAWWVALSAVLATASFVMLVREFRLRNAAVAGTNVATA